MHEADTFFKYSAFGMVPFCASGTVRFYPLGMGRANFISASNSFGLAVCATLTYGLVLGRLGLPTFKRQRLRHAR